MKYYVRIFDADGGSFGPGTLIAEFEKAKNIGYADYINDVPEAFFTLSQVDPKITSLRNHKGKYHVLIYRDDDLVWAGFLGEHDANATDAVFYAYGYAAELSHLHSDWGTAYTNAQIDTIVSDAWTRAKTTLTSSRLGWVTTGTIEAPVTTSGGATAVVLPSYELFYKNTLQLFREMSALGIGDTTNVVHFEITPAGTFNFWKNDGSALDVLWRYPNGDVRDFRESYVPLFTFNDILGVGVNPNSDTLRQNEVNSSSITAIGRRQATAFFSWVRDSTELDRAMKHRLAKSLREDFDFTLTFKNGRVLPPGATGAGWDIGDRVAVSLDRGVTYVNANTQMVSGYQVVWMQGRETVRAIMQERPGT